LRGRPTLVQNVETLAHLAVIAHRGPAAFRRSGTEAEPGSFLATVGGAVATPGVYEAPYAFTLAPCWIWPVARRHRCRRCWSAATTARGLADRDAVSAPMSRAGLAPFGATPGAAWCTRCRPSYCGLVETARITGYLAEQSARQCGPCRNGLPMMAATLRLLAAGEAGSPTARPTHATRRAGGEPGACHHPDGTVRLVRSALRVFATEIDLHLAGRCSTVEGRR